MANDEITAKFSRHLIGLTRRVLSTDRVKAIRDHQIRKRAYRKWEEAGRPWGREEEFWQAGERQFVAEQEKFWGVFDEPALPRYGGSLE